MSAKTSHQALIARINAANGLSLLYTQVYVDQVMATTTAEANAHGGANTKALIKPLPLAGSALKGQKWVYYNRISLASVLPASVTASSPVSISSIWWATELQYTINNLLGLSLTLERRDLLNYALATYDGNPQTTHTDTLYAGPNSLAYTGSTSISYAHNYTSRSVGSSNGDYSTCAPGMVGVAYSCPLFCTGPHASYTSSIIAGSLPPGLTLTASGSYGNVTISGTPTTAGTYNFTLGTYPSDGTAGQGRALTIVISPAASVGWNTSKMWGLAFSNDTYRAYQVGAAAAGYCGSVLGAFNLANAKHYVEFAVGVAPGTSNMEVGIATSDYVPASRTTPPSSTPYAWMAQQRTGGLVNNGVVTGVAAVSGTPIDLAWTESMTISMAVDATNMAAVKVWMGKAGTWWGGGNPATGTSPTFTFNATGKSIYPCLGIPRVAGLDASVYLLQSTPQLKAASMLPTGFTCPYSS